MYIGQPNGPSQAYTLVGDAKTSNSASVVDDPNPPCKPPDVFCPPVPNDRDLARMRQKQLKSRERRERRRKISEASRKRNRR